MNKKTQFWLGILVSGLALVLHAVLTFEHYKTQLAIGDGPSALCHAGDYFDCSVVAASSYSHIFGIPLALFGFWTNLLFLISWIWFHIKSLWLGENSPQARVINFSLAMLLVTASLVMGSISFLAIGKLCLYCLLTYFISFIQLGLHVTSISPKETLSILSSNSLIKGLGVLTMIPAGAWITQRVWDKSVGADRLDYYIHESVSEWLQNPVHEFHLERGIIYRNSSQAKHYLVEFVDLFCPHCKHASHPLKAFIQSRPDLAIIVKLFPLDGNCNPAIEHSSPNPIRCEWAKWLLCINQQNPPMGSKALDWIFEHQSELATKSFEEGRKDAEEALTLPIPKDQLTQCMQNPDTEQALRSLGEEGQKAKIQGTPSIFLNGRLLPRAQVLPILEKAYSALKP
jgi:uncharacterized membrane protein/protein-disulfide isomerase